ncbi:MAG: ATP-binding cassette domain-containing protein [Rhodobacteraceae bacterium]|nr:ATP-binding cassette domain-containing protein [Paracoccaceae bacterium]
MTDPVIELTEVGKSFGSNRVLRNISLTVGHGESFALIGSSGTGKSVAIKCILGLMRPDTGRISLFGRETGGRDAAMYDRIGMLFQEGALFDSMCVWHNVAFRLMRGERKLAPARAKEIAVRKLERVGLGAETADLYPSELSGGMKKRVGLARAIATDPELIFFDEPTTGLDPIRATMINDLIRGIVTESGATAVTITHDMGSVMKISNRAGLLHAGEIVWLGSSDTLKTESNPFIRQFVEGSSEGPISVAI